MEALRKAISDDLEEEGLVSVPLSESDPFSESDLSGDGVPGSSIKFFRMGGKRPHSARCQNASRRRPGMGRPANGTLVDAAHGGTGRKILLTTPPESPSLAGAMRIVEGLKTPAAAKFDGERPIEGS